MIDFFQQSYIKLSKAKSFFRWTQEGLHRQRKNDLQQWFFNFSGANKTNLNLSSLLPIPGDELFDLGGGNNILDLAILQQRYDILEVLIAKGFSGCMGAQEDPHDPVFSLHQFFKSHYLSSCSNKPLPIFKSICLDDEKAFNILLNDKTLLLSPQNPFLALYKTILFHGASSCLSVLMKRNFALTSIDGHLLIEEQRSTSTYHDFSLLQEAVTWCPDNNVKAVFLSIDKIFDIKKQLSSKKTRDALVAKALNRNSQEILTELLVRRVNPNEPIFSEQNTIVKKFTLPNKFHLNYPLYLACYNRAPPEIIDTLLKYGASWFVDGFDLGQEIENLSLLNPYAYQIYKTQKDNQETKNILDAILKEKINVLDDKKSNKRM